ncbi:guanine nucleotide-releasing factor 2-like isoform X2 [Bolinopsis microptera]|uniref:guanine nucleotide-releasing factor 2-like isoform X2 n=1 Tax=Bolinopsis microptera TaxID=2820187 RepID=UPI0030794973
MIIPETSTCPPHFRNCYSHYNDLAESYKLSGTTSDQPTPALSMLQTVHEVILGVRDTMDNAEQLRATLPRGISSLSELDKCQTELHQALSTLVLWTNRQFMLNATSDTEPSALVSPVTQLIQKMMSICLQNYHPDSRGMNLQHDMDELQSQSSGHGSLPNTENFALFQGNTRYSNYSSQSSESYNDSLPLGWSPYNHRHSILSSDSIPEDEAPDLPPPHPSLLNEGAPLPHHSLVNEGAPPPLPPPAASMLRKKSAYGSLEKKHGAMPPPLPPRVKGPLLPPRYGSQSSNISGEFSNLALFESHTYCTSGHFADYNGNGESRGSSMSSSLDRGYDYNMSHHGGGTPAPPPPVPSRQLSYSISRDTGIWVEGSVTSHRSSSSHYTDDSDSESESDADSGLEDEEPDEPPPLPPKNRLTFSQLYSLRLLPNVPAPPPPLPPRAYNFELKGMPANGAFPEGPPPTLPTRSNSGHFNGAKNYTRMMDRYAPSFEIDEEYLKMSLQEPNYHEQELKESIYHTYHRDEAQAPPATYQVPPPPTRPITPPRPPIRTIAETTETVDSTEVDADERTGILFEVDPAPELMYNYGPAKQGDSMHSYIKGGTVDALIAEATIYRDAEFVQTIIFTHSTFTTTDDILKKCMKRYQFYAQTNTKLAETCVKLFNDVLSNVWMYLTKPMIDVATEFVKILFEDKQMSLALTLQNTLLTQFQYCREHKCDVMYSPATSISSEHLNWTFFLKVKPRDIAHQMTQIDFDKFSKIKLCEILKYVKAPSETTSPNMCSFVNHFNSVSFWASSLVLRRETKDERQRVYRRLLSVMEHLIKLNNFSSAFALFAALCKTAVRRVVNLSSKQEKILDNSQTLMDSSESYKNLRSALKSATPPLIAYLGLCMADLTFLIHGNPDKLESGHVNFTKRHLTYTFMNVVRTSQAVPYNITPRDDIITFFNNFSDYMEEEEMWTRSEQIKPRKKRS